MTTGQASLRTAPLPLKLLVVTSIYDLGNGPVFTALVERFQVLLRACIYTGTPLAVFHDCDDPVGAYVAISLELYRVPLSKLVSWHRRALSSTEAWKTCQAGHLPEMRNAAKDTREYMILMNSKTEFVAQAAKEHSEHDEFYLMFLDAGISKIASSANVLEDCLASWNATWMNNPAKLPDVTCVHIPGCAVSTVRAPEWSTHAALARVKHSILWRFCGGAFVVSASQACAWNRCCQQALQAASIETGHVWWEVNTWALVEHYCSCWAADRPSWAADCPEIQWISADHNDTMLRALMIEKP